MSQPHGEGLAASGSFWLEIEMLPTDSIKFVLTGWRRRPMIFPKNGMEPTMELLADSHYMKPCTAVGLIRCSRASLGIFKWYTREYRGSGRKYATSLGSKGVL